MADTKGTQTESPDPAELSATMASIAERSQRIVTGFLSRQGNLSSSDPSALDPLNVGSAFMEMTSRMMSNPGKMVEAQMSLWQDYMDLWQSTARRMMGDTSGDTITPERDDRRFRDDMWNENEVFDYIKQSYLLSARWIQDVVRDVDGLDDKTAAKVDFYTRQFVDALAPTNFVMTNPEVLRATIESGGENLINGLDNLLSDLEDGKGNLRIKMTDQDAFEIGKNIAVTPGKVVFQNDLMQLVQYTPTTDKVKKTPLMIIPPWINKFYILDLREKNSFIKWAVGEGHSVFVISWVNPDGSLRDKSFEDYMLEGPIAGLEAVEKATGIKKINVIGYCLGGTLLAATLSYMKTKKIDRVASATFFTTMVDFSEAGELGVFIDETQL
ncbi:MAG: class I poly(R)-hydroxyalkanoic acid synthase, partial [Rhodospirillales bacterium]